MDSGLTSVIIVSYHTGPALDTVLAAALAQTEPVELVLVNNGNAAELEARLAEQARSDPRLQIVSGQGNIGLGAGWNLGAQTAKGDYLLFLGENCVLPPDAVARLRQRAGGKPRPCVFGVRLVDDRGRYMPESRRFLLTPVMALVRLAELGSFLPKLRDDFGRTPLPEECAAVPAVSGEVLFISTEDLVRLKGFNETFVSPVAAMDFFQRLHHAEGSAYFVPDLVAKRLRSAPFFDALDREKDTIRSEMRYFHEHFNHSHAQPLLWLLDALLWLRYGVLYLKSRIARVRRK